MQYATIIRTAALGCFYCLFGRRAAFAFAPRSASTRRAFSTFSRHVGVLQDYRSSTETNFEHETTTTTDFEDDVSGCAFSIDAYGFESSSLYHDFYENAAQPNEEDKTVVVDADPSKVGFVFPESPKRPDPASETAAAETLLAASPGSSSYYPFAAMMQGSAPYIADHTSKVVVFHIPGELLDDSQASDSLLQDIALCWLLDMKIVIVAGCRLDLTNECSPEQCPMEYSHECHNALKVTDRATLRTVEEEAGYLRTEIERKLNRCLRAHGGTAHGSDGDHTAAPPNGNIVSGNFYTAQRFGEIRGEDFQYTGFAAETHTENIHQVLNSNDVVLLSTVGLSPMGELVNVNGYHLAATVAASLKASKLIFLSNNSCLLKLLSTDEGSDDEKQQQHPPIIQELPMSLAQAITNYHNVKCHNTGFATFQKAQRNLPPAAVELLLHLGWASWAVDRGVVRSHIVNPGDGALLEELFTSKNGANTCLFHDNELEDDASHSQGDIDLEDFDDFFNSALENHQRVAFFG